MARSSLLFDLFAASQQVKTLLTKAMAGAGLRPDEYAVYSGVFEFGPITPTELAGVIGVPPTTLSHYIRHMREAGHLVEKKQPRDGRSRALSLSPTGLASHRRANRAFEVAYAAFVARIGDQAAIKSALAGVETAAREALADVR
jgi:DNA-binding MarR family transcriptional regulator